jgi:hypothetical protein
VCLKDGRNREELADHLLSEANHDCQIVVGFDFAFSLPAWFLKQRGLSNAKELWRIADQEAETWLAECRTPFWGKPGKPRPAADHKRDQFRRTELEVPAVAGIRPKSVFQIGGAGAVGTGSLRGFPILSRLAEAGLSVWPFDSPGLPQVVEIYPRLLTGPVNKGDTDARAAYLESRGYTIDEKLYLRAVCSEDAFDAAVSALVMYENLDALTELPQINDRQTLLEGLIWHTEWRSHASVGFL